MADFRLRQNGMTVASAAGPDPISTEGEILHYAMKYRQDGAVTIERKHITAGSPKGYWKRHMLMEQWPVPQEAPDAE